MGVFDFVKNAGAKVGIGKSTDEEAAEAAAEEQAKKDAQTRAEASAKLAKVRREARKEREEAARDERKEAVRKNVEARRRKTEAKERMKEYSKSQELEKYVKELGLDASDIDVRYDDGTAYVSGEVADQETRERIILAIGNAHGVGKVDEEITISQDEPEAEAHFHTVAPGDTLWAVAEKVYGDGSQYPKIFEANKPMLKDPDLIFPGQVLRCPMD